MANENNKIYLAKEVNDEIRGLRIEILGFRI